MNGDRWKNLEVLFEQAVGMSPEERAAFVETACGGDPALRAELTSLLACYEAKPAFLEDLAEALYAPMFGYGPEDLPSRLDSYGMVGRQVSRYEVLEVIGGGGMGIVYKARDTTLDRLVALKFLPLHLRADQEARQRFIHEARAASALDHPNIATVYEVGRAEQGQLYIAMPYYEGETVRQKLVRGPLPIDAVLDFAIQAARGLARAHGRSIVHRDIKPANLIVTAEGVLKIVDFGLAKIAGTRLTRTGATLGTLAYMSPEQVRGDAVDHRTDLWSLGVVLYEMLTGRLPFEGRYEQAIAFAILYEPPEPPSRLRPEVPAALEVLVERLLQKDAAARPADAAAVLADLEGLRRPLPARARQRPERKAAVLAGALVLLLAGIGIVLQQGLTPASPPAEEQVVAVLPFNLSDEVPLHGADLSRLLSLQLDDAETIRSVDPYALLSRVEGKEEGVLDVALGRKIAHAFGAGYFILGSVSRIGTALFIDASLYDAKGEALQAVQVRAAGVDEMPGAVTQLAQRLVAGHLQVSGQDLESLAVLTTGSWRAMNLYLQGEQALYEANFHVAQETFEQAVAEDSTFALAWYRLAQAAGWHSDQTRQDQALAQAVRYMEDAPVRARRLIEAEALFLQGRFAAAKALLGQLLRTYPDDAHAHFMLGDLLYHYNPLYGRPASEGLQPLMRALSYDPNNGELLLHVIEIAAIERDAAALDTLVPRYVAQAREQNWRLDAFRLARGLLQGDPAARDTVLEGLQEKEPWHLAQVAIWLIAKLKDVGTAKRLARLAADAAREPERAWRYQLLAKLEMAQGRVRAADSALTQAERKDYGNTLVLRALQHTLPFYSASAGELEHLRAQVARWDTAAAPLTWEGAHAGELGVVRTFLQGLLSWRLDDRAAVREAGAALLRQAGTRRGESLAYSFSKTLDALLAVQEGEADAALEALDAAQLTAPSWKSYHSPLYLQALNRYLRAELLFAKGRYGEALPWYASLIDGEYDEGVAYLGPSYLRRAQIYDRLGKDEQAADSYARFVELWRDGDPAFQEQVEQARARLHQLRRGRLR